MKDGHEGYRCESGSRHVLEAESVECAMVGGSDAKAGVWCSLRLQDSVLIYQRAGLH